MTCLSRTICLGFLTLFQEPDGKCSLAWVLCGKQASYFAKEMAGVSESIELEILQNVPPPDRSRKAEDSGEL